MMVNKLLTPAALFMMLSSLAGCVLPSGSESLPEQAPGDTEDSLVHGGWLKQLPGPIEMHRTWCPQDYTGRNCNHAVPSDPCDLTAYEAKTAAEMMPWTDCHSFWQCVHGAGSDPSVIAACVSADPDGALEWQAIVAEQCSCGWAPSEQFCSMTYGDFAGL